MAFRPPNFVDRPGRPHSSGYQTAYDTMMKNITLSQASMRNRQAQVELQRMKDLKEMFSQNTQVFGKYLVNGPGEAMKDVKFPVAFSNVPVVTFGFEVRSENNLVWTEFDDQHRPYPRDTQPGVAAGAYSGLVHGEAPIITGLVSDWIAEEVPPHEQRFIGASLLTVSDGPIGTKFIVHWSAAGMAYANPSAGPMQDNLKPVTDLQQVGSLMKWSPGHPGIWNGEWYNADETPPDLAAWAQLIGETLVEARSLASAQGYTVRVVEQDGERFVVTMDYKPKRINVAVVSGAVTAVRSLG